MKILDLFSGIGGFSLGLERSGMETVAFCEIEEYPQRILKKHWPDVPIYDDVTKLTKEVLDKDGIRSVELIYGGFPCQPYSVAGKQAGKEDDRHLWPEMFRLIKEIKPRWVIGENVAGFITMALDDVLFDLESKGYETQSFVIPACAVGGIHRRDRVWIVANSNNDARRLKFGSSSKSKDQRPAGSTSRSRKNVAYSDNKRLQGKSRSRSDGSKRKKSTDQQPARCGSSSGFRPIEPPTEPAVRHRDDGLPDNVARLKALGNAVVPQIPELIGRAIMEIERGNL